MTKAEIISFFKQQIEAIQAMEIDYDSYVVRFGGQIGLYIGSCEAECTIVDFQRAIKLNKTLARVQAKIKVNGAGEKSTYIQWAVARIEEINHLKKMVSNLEAL